MHVHICSLTYINLRRKFIEKNALVGLLLGMKLIHSAWHTITPVAITIFKHVVRTSICLQFSKSRQISNENNDCYWRDYGSGREDHWGHYFFHPQGTDGISSDFDIRPHIKQTFNCQFKFTRLFNVFNSLVALKKLASSVMDHMISGNQSLDLTLEPPRCPSRQNDELKYVSSSGQKSSIVCCVQDELEDFQVDMCPREWFDCSNVSNVSEGLWKVLFVLCCLPFCYPCYMTRCVELYKTFKIK